MTFVKIWRSYGDFGSNYGKKFYKIGHAGGVSGLALLSLLASFLFCCFIKSFSKFTAAPVPGTDSSSYDHLNLMFAS